MLLISNKGWGYAQAFPQHSRFLFVKQGGAGGEGGQRFLPLPQQAASP